MNYRKIISLVIVILLMIAYGCDIADLPPVPKRDNPTDPSNQSFEPPMAVIFTGPKTNTVIDTHSVTFAWKGKLENKTTFFSFRRDGNPWSTYDTVSRVSYEFLDEGTYVFEVKAKYQNESEQTNPTTVNFTVNAVAGPAVIFFPRKTSVMRNGLFSVNVMIDEATDFAGAKIAVNFNPKIFALEGTPEIFKDQRSLLIKNGGTVIDVVETNPMLGTILMNLAVAGGTQNNVSGSGAVARLTFKAIGGVGTRNEIFIGSASSLRKDDNTVIPIKMTATAVVDIL